MAKKAEKKPFAKATNAVSALRTNEIYGRLTKGQSRHRIQQDLAKEWDLSERQIDEYLAKARVLIEKDCDIARPAFLAECLAGIREIRENAERRGQHQVALNAVQLMTKLTGLTD